MADVSEISPRDRAMTIQAKNQQPPVVTLLSKYLDGEYHPLKEDLRQFIRNNKLFNMEYSNLNLQEQRYLAHERAKAILRHPKCKNQLDEQVRGSLDFMKKNLILGEVFAFVDPSTNVKLGVMVFLFGGAIINLGSAAQVQKWLGPLKDLQYTGMFAMTERGHGSNVRCIETEATYNIENEEFIINTPTRSAQKMFIGNGLHGEYAIVFAQLILHNKSKGPHAFIVPIRNENGLYPGVTVVDLGLKEGMNGVDNCLLSFDHVRIPREHLLNKYADVLPNGSYVTDILKDSTRFNIMLAALIGTRLAVANHSTACMSVGLTIAIRYAHSRLQFGPSNKQEMSIMSYQTHQIRLMPLLAKYLSLYFTGRQVASLVDDHQTSGGSIATNREIQALASGIKAYASWACVQTMQICRECTGGQGYMAENRIAGLKGDVDVFVTYEGDNTILLQQVAKELLVQYRKEYTKGKFSGMLSFLTKAIVVSLQTSSLIPRMHSITSYTFQTNALEFREARLLQTLASRLANKVQKNGMDSFMAWNECLHHLNALAMSHVERVCYEQFVIAVKQCPYPGPRSMLAKCCKLYGLNCIYSDRGWYLEESFINAKMAKCIRTEVLKLCKETAEFSLEIVNSLRIPDNCIHAPIAGIGHDNTSWLFAPGADSNTDIRMKSKL
ncbi:Acyl-coenzyme A oxidase-like protein [Trichoplax sp. H2]|nr:Acyl-coenzyme A oxidase-like protein [Trichoplax sp. H2]|eukprot:RDD44314.1 Acyl-coenzyme A oxidase-like protein [Trichoplax sp. H2]